MEIFKLLSLSFGVQADFSKIYNNLTQNSANMNRVLKIMEMNSTQTLFLNKGQESELIFILFNQPNRNTNFSFQKHAITYNEQLPIPEEITLNDVIAKIENNCSKILELLKNEKIQFISSPFLHIEFVYKDQEKNYSELLIKHTLPKINLENSKLVKSTLGYTITKKLGSIDNNYVQEILIEHWIKNKEFLFVSSTTQWNIIEYQYKDLSFFKEWVKEIFTSANDTIKKLEEE
ncbi:hypothetical protein [Thermosipho globiformans]|uniref:hypothetical protein n=1 Tax=Thermosipho globiformans TaxID=380685 RepID=UPI000F8CE801|nr:hypothetical protein [Thermosipho globiformans]